MLELVLSILPEESQYTRLEPSVKKRRPLLTFYTMYKFYTLALALRRPFHINSTRNFYFVY